MRIRYLPILFPLLINGCADGTPTPSITVRIMGDYSHHTYAWVFAFRGDQVVAQRHLFPGYDEPAIFRLRHASNLIPDEYFSGDGNVEPPFLPGGPWFYRVDVAFEGPGEERSVYFANDTDELRVALPKLKATVMSEGERLETLPTWVIETPSVSGHFGLRE